MMRNKNYKVLLWFLGILLLNGCATFGAGTTSKKTALDYSRERLRDAPVENYVNQVVLHLTNNESPKEIGFSKIATDVLKTSRIQGSSWFDRPQIEITRGMLNVLMNEAELACLLGHEIGHKVLHRNNTRHKKGDSLADIFLPDDMAEAKWNQDREQEADEYGAELCYRTGYSPYALLDFMERMAQFQRNDFLTALNELTATHKDFANRANYLRKFLEKSHIPLDKGVLKRVEYIRSLTSLRHIQSGDAVNELLPGGVNHTLQRLNTFEQELKNHLRDKQSLAPTRFVKIMEEISGVVRQYEISGTKFATGTQPFMKEVLSQDSPLWDNAELKKKIEEVLKLAGRIGVGFIPVVGDAVDLYEFLTGKEFGTNYPLSLNERVITIAGLLAGSGKLWRGMVNGIELTLKDAGVVQKVGRRAVSDGQYAVNKGIEVLDATKKEQLTVIGRYPRYLQKAEKIGAHRFNVTTDIWNKMTKAEQWVANKKFLDRAIRRGDSIILSDSVKNIKDVSGAFRQELDYLIEQGFKLTKDGMRMVRQ